MLKNEIEIEQIIKKIIASLEESNEVKWSCVLKKLLFEYYDEENKKEIVEKILGIYKGGMGSFSDLVLQKEGKMCVDENEKLDELTTKLYNACVNYLAS